MDFGENNEAPNSKVRDFDLNIAYVEEEDFDLNAENESSPILMDTQQLASQNSIQNMMEHNMNIEAANKGDNEVEQSPAAENTTTEDTRHDEAKHIASVPFEPGRILRSHCRRRRRQCKEAKQSDDANRFCTNFDCKTRRTPLWRKGPLGPKTLCNACGLQYLKTVAGKGKEVPAAVSDEDGGSSSHDDASPGPVSAETVEGDSNL